VADEYSVYDSADEEDEGRLPVAPDRLVVSEAASGVRVVARRGRARVAHRHDSAEDLLLSLAPERRHAA